MLKKWLVNWRKRREETKARKLLEKRRADEDFDLAWNLRRADELERQIDLLLRKNGASDQIRILTEGLRFLEKQRTAVEMRKLVKEYVQWEIGATAAYADLSVLDYGQADANIGYKKINTELANGEQLRRRIKQLPDLFPIERLEMARRIETVLGVLNTFRLHLERIIVMKTVNGITPGNSVKELKVPSDGRRAAIELLDRLGNTPLDRNSLKDKIPLEDFAELEKSLEEISKEKASKEE